MTYPEGICWVVDLGVPRYTRTFELQQRLVAARKRAEIPDTLLICEHPHVITLGRNGKREHLHASEHLLRQMDCEFHLTNRGGDITYHGPGQIVGYPIVDLTRLRRDVAWYVDRLEELMIRATAELGVDAFRVDGMHGIWVNSVGSAEKLAALGVHLSRWVTSHGFAYNVSTDLRYFDLIVPCGLADKRATSLERVLGRRISMSEVRPKLIANFGETFGRELQPKSYGELEAALEQTPAMAIAS
jgi:lipoyl(octanoyl) transferase